MNVPSRYPESPAELCREDYWITKPTTWPYSATAYDPYHDTEAPKSTEHPTAYVDEDDSYDEDHATAPETGADSVPLPNQDANPPPDTNPNPPRPATTTKPGLKQYTRANIELQLATLTEYVRNKALQPLEWICCSCSTSQKYRESLLPPLDRLRCHFPRCGVSAKGFRIYRVHHMCDQCTVFVDVRVPVTKKALRKKRNEVRGVLRKIKKVYEDVNRLGAFDDEEAERMAGLVRAKEAREEFEREEQEQEDLCRTEMEQLRRDEWVNDDGANSGAESQYEETVEGEEGDKGEEEEGRHKVKGKPQKRRGLKALFGL